MVSKLTKKQLLNLWRGLNMVGAGEYGVKFSYAVARNKQRLEPVIKTLQDVIKPLEEFEKKRIALVQEHAVRREDGSLLSLPSGEHPIKDVNAFNDQLEKLKIETGQDKRDEDIEELLKEAEDFDIFMCSFDYLPDAINPVIVELLLPMISEPSDD